MYNTSRRHLKETLVMHFYIINQSILVSVLPYIHTPQPRRYIARDLYHGAHCGRRTHKM
jgi:hypothetical protein